MSHHASNPKPYGDTGMVERLKRQAGEATDPTKRDMKVFLLRRYRGEEGASDSAEIAIYYFAALYHGGQGSNLYSALSTSPYRPGRAEREPEPGSLESMMLTDLIERFGGYASNPRKRRANHHNDGTPTGPSSAFFVDKWEERDRLHIALYFDPEHAGRRRGERYSGDGQEVASWWDDDARGMFEDGFFEARRLEGSVIDYAEQLNMIRVM